MLPKEFINRVIRRIIWTIKRPTPTDLLEMIWPESLLLHSPEIKLAKGYQLRQFELRDTENYYELFTAASMDKPPLDYWQKHVLPDGFFIIEHIVTQTLVGACFASHHPNSRHLQAGNLGWLAVHPKHRGNNLGQALAAAVTTRLLTGGYRQIYLETHDHRLPAIATYLKLGWQPLLYLPEMQSRWASICHKLHWPFEPESWPKLCNYDLSN